MGDYAPKCTMRALDVLKTLYRQKYVGKIFVVVTLKLSVLDQSLARSADQAPIALQETLQMARWPAVSNLARDCRG